ncbi:meiotic recombination protein DMC1/LIM15 homolog [Zophobas morio]|uniref:meiotic recombination protein DMC1/LIM15 homolog n=1 Tax=Zophobas morio TaxID=2755281 RepID=UPI0030835841
MSTLTEASLLVSQNANEQELLEDESLLEEEFFQVIDELQKFGINAADINKLKSNGVSTVQGVLMQTTKFLCGIKGLSEAKVEKIREAAKKIKDVQFITALEFSHRRRTVLHMTTGSSELDKLLQGGFETQQISEIFGEFRTGKTQLCHTLCVTCQLPLSDGGAAGKVAYIDTEGTFRPDRLVSIARRFNLDADIVLENTMFARAYTSDHQLELITLCAAKFAEDRGLFKLLIIDSIIALLRVDYSGRGELADRQQKLARMLSYLTKIAEQFNVAVVITNQMTADPGAGMSFVADPKKPVGGHVLSHASHLRLSLRKGRGDNRICKIYDSPNLPESEGMFSISEGGICDPTQ